MKGLHLGIMLIFMAGCVVLTACDETNIRAMAEPTEEEWLMPESSYYTTELTAIPQAAIDAVAHGPIPADQALAPDDVNLLVKPDYPLAANGYIVYDDNTAYVAVRSYFPKANKGMITWWYWWHALKDLRYKIWYPGYHYAVGFENIDQMLDPALSYEERIWNNPQYPLEDVGTGIKMPLVIRFVPPETFGFDTSKFEENGVAAVICGVVGMKVGDQVINHTSMCHLFRTSGDGLELRSRFWLGSELGSRVLRRMFINEDMATSMLLHCSGEYTHLASFLPEIYEEFKTVPTEAD